jgi:hypothetical protein
MVIYIYIYGYIWIWLYNITQVIILYNEYYGNAVMN